MATFFQIGDKANYATLISSYEGGIKRKERKLFRNLLVEETRSTPDGQMLKFKGFNYFVHSSLCDKVKTEPFGAYSNLSYLGL